MLELTEAAGLPAVDPGIFKEAYGSLAEYLEPFAAILAVMRTAESIERIAYEFACDCFAENVLYFEARFAPQLHATAELSIEQVLVAVNSGFERATREFNARPQVEDGSLPPAAFGIIVCAMRMWNADMSPYFRDFLRMHPSESPARVSGLASMALITAAVAVRNEHGIPIVALDIAGAEDGFPAHHHTEAYQYASKHFVNKTVHAGEAYGPVSIFEALSGLNSDRIGHGYHLYAEDRVTEQEHARLGMSPKDFVRQLSQYVARNRITLEVCLTSNLQTIPELKGDLGNHPMRRMLQDRLSLVLATDNRTVSHTTLCAEIRKALEAFGMGPKALKDTIIGAFKRSFYPGTYVQKRAYVRRVINYYEECERRFGVVVPGRPDPRDRKTSLGPD